MKVLLPDLTSRQELADRFLREIKLLASLHHPNIAELRTALSVDNQLVMIMEYVDGITLASRVEQGAIPPALALNYIDQVLAALQYAHGQGVIHRDIKPANMMLTPQGVVKLMDFGIARSDADHSLTMTGTTLGSLAYMSPEQVRGTGVDKRSDIYSVGVSLYEMVTGQRPFQSDSDFSVMSAHLQQSPKPPIEVVAGLPAQLNELILMAMAKDPGERFQSAEAFKAAVGGLIAGLGDASQQPTATRIPPAVPATPSPSEMPTVSTLRVDSPVPSQAQVPPVADYSVKPSSSRGLYMALGALVVLAVLVAAGLYLPRRNRASAQAEAPTQSNATSTPSLPATPSSAAENNATPPAPEPPPAAEAWQTPASVSPNGSFPAPPTATHPSEPLSYASKHASGAAHSAAPIATPNPPPMAEDNGAAEDAAMDELEKQMDQLTGRAAAAQTSLNNMRAQQAAAGLGMRGDITAAQQRLEIDMSKAQAALQNHDMKSAKKYLDMAETETATLEKFLGR